MMAQMQLKENEVARRGKALYAEHIRTLVETEANIGKLVYIDTETGDYEIGDDIGLDAPHRLQSKHPDAALYAIRIGYNVVDSFGGVVERTSR